MRSLLPILVLATAVPCAAGAADLTVYPGYTQRHVRAYDPPAVGGPVARRAHFVRVRHLHATSGQAFARIDGRLVLVDTETQPMRVIDIIR